MSREKFDWSSVGGYPADEAHMTPSINQPNQSSLLDKIAESLSGAGLGLAQGGSDIGANIAHFPSDVYTYFTGKPGYDTPKPDLRSWGPQSDVGKGAESLGEFAAPFALSPGLALETQLGKSLFGGKLLPRAALESLLGSSESDNRGLGLGLGALTPAVGKAIRFVKETPLTRSGAIKKMNKASELAGEEPLGIPMNMDFIRNLEYQMGSNHLKPSRMAINNLLGEAAKGDYQSYHKLQSALGDISRELIHPEPQTGKGFFNMIGNLFSRPQTTASERLTGNQLNELRNQYVKEAMEHLEKTGKGKIANLATQGKREYANYKNFKPYRNALMAAIAGSAGVPGYGLIKHIFSHE
ncbi:MAG TPA: hypothetical protein VGJ00_10335 [Rhabdochlamydiaceae bacterium]|jgi:hypothetical protein